MNSHQELKEILSRDKAYRNLINRYDLRYEISSLITRARISKGYSQEKLAKLIDSKQPNIARLENGSALPSLNTLEKIAKAFSSYLIAPKFAFLEDEDKETAKTTYTSPTLWRHDRSSSLPDSIKFQVRQPHIVHSVQLINTI